MLAANIVNTLTLIQKINRNKIVTVFSGPSSDLNT